MSVVVQSCCTSLNYAVICDCSCISAMLLVVGSVRLLTFSVNLMLSHCFNLHLPNLWCGWTYFYSSIIHLGFLVYQLLLILSPFFFLLSFYFWVVGALYIFWGLVLFQVCPMLMSSHLHIIFHFVYIIFYGAKLINYSIINLSVLFYGLHS